MGKIRSKRNEDIQYIDMDKLWKYVFFYIAEDHKETSDIDFIKWNNFIWISIRIINQLVFYVSPTWFFF